MKKEIWIVVTKLYWISHLYSNFQVFVFQDHRLINLWNYCVSCQFFAANIRYYENLLNFILPEFSHYFLILLLLLKLFVMWSTLLNFINLNTCKCNSLKSTFLMVFFHFVKAKVSKYKLENLHFLVVVHALKKKYRN